MRSTCISVLALPLLTCCGYAQMMPGQPAWVTPAPIPADGKFYQAESTRVMAALLKKIYSETDWVFDATKQAQRAQYYQSLLRNNLSFRDEATVRQQLAVELLGAGDSRSCRGRP